MAKVQADISALQQQHKELLAAVEARRRQMRFILSACADLKVGPRQMG